MHIFSAFPSYKVTENISYTIGWALPIAKRKMFVWEDKKKREKERMKERRKNEIDNRSKWGLRKKASKSIKHSKFWDKKKNKLK